MTANQFRRLALAISGAVEASHMNHPDFRIGGRIFASLGYPDEDSGMVKLPLADQKSLIEKAPGVFAPCAGAWGRNGATSVALPRARMGDVQAALKAASEQLSQASVKPKSSRPRPRRRLRRSKA